MDSFKPNKDISWDDLLVSLNDSFQHPVETTWDIYYYLKNNYQTDGSLVSRQLLRIFIALRIERPSLINSLMLGVALRVSHAYRDFNLPRFLDIWDYSVMLRPEDCMVMPSKDGKPYLTLKDKVDRALKSYRLHHSTAIGSKEDIHTMIAVKVYEKVRDGDNCSSVKLIDSQGMELFADSQRFPLPTAEIQGRLFDVLVHKAKSGTQYVSEIVVSEKTVETVFEKAVGYVDRIDERHGHFHIYDTLSRHFVAENPIIRPDVGGFVRFCPIIADGDKFKSAIIVGTLDVDEGYSTFGMVEAEVVAIDHTYRKFRYAVTSLIPTSDGGVIAKDGVASLDALDARQPLSALKVGCKVRLILFLKRGRDRVKRNYVARFQTCPVG